MRIGINGYFLGQETTGSGQYIFHLLRHLDALDTRQSTAYSVLVPKIDVAADQESKLPTPLSQDKLTWTEMDIPIPHADLAKLWWEQVAFPRACRRAEVDLFHVPYFAPPLVTSIPAVVTIHDLIPLVLPAYRGTMRIRLYMQMVALAAKRAAAIITDSEAAKQDILQHLTVPADRVHVVYLAAQESYRPADTPLAASFRTRYDLPKRYLLYLGGFDQRRNIHTLLEAFRHVLDCLQQSRKGSLPRLVLAGSLPEEDDIFTLDPRRMIEELGLAPWARCLGRIPEADKLPLYQGAEIFVFPSVYEGFGLPPLEAMACGTPVIAADATSLPEIVGDGGLLVPPRDVGAWSEAIYTLWLDKEARTALRIKALSQAAKFSWEKTARETWEIYRRVADTAIADSSQI